MIPQQGAGIANVRPIDNDAHLVAIELHAFNGARIPVEQAGQRWMSLQLFEISDRGSERHQR